MAMKNITEILQTSSLGKIVERASNLNELNRIIPQIMPAQYAGLYRVANLVNDQLVFDVKNASVRQGLLLQEAILLNRIQQYYPKISLLVFRVRPYFN